MRQRQLAALLVVSLLTTAAAAQTPTQNTSSANTNKSGQRNTSSTDGLQRKGSANPGPKESTKMQKGVSRSGNSNLSPTSPTNVPPPGGDKPNTTQAGVTKPSSASGTAKSGTASSTKPGSGSGAAKPSAKDKAMSKAMMEESAKKRQTLGTSGTKNGNTGNAPEAPTKTQGSTSEGDGSVASPGGAKGTNTRETQSAKPQSRPAAMASTVKSQSAAGGQPMKAKKN